MTPAGTEASDRTVDSTTLFVPLSTEGTPTTQFTAEFGRLKPGDHGWTELMEAALQGDERVVKKLLCKGVDVNERQTYGGTALMVALDSGHTEIAQILLDAGADVNIRGQGGTTALGTAVLHAEKDMVKILLDKGADPNGWDNLFNESILEVASRVGPAEIVQMLLQKGADTKSYGDKALAEAAQHGHADIAELLLAAGVDPNSETDRYGKDKTALHLSATDLYSKGKTALHLAAENGSLAVLQVLLAHGADLNKYGAEALSLALSKGHSPFSHALIQAGVGADAKGKDRETTFLGKEHATALLIIAAKNGLEEPVRNLLENGADIHADDGWATALEYADEAGNPAVVKALLAKEPPAPRAVGLIYMEKSAGNSCELRMYDLTSRQTTSLCTLEGCPKKIYVDEAGKTIFVIKGNTVQEIAIRPEVVVKPPLTLPLCKGRNEADDELRGRDVVRFGHLADGRLAVIYENVRPADDSDYYLYALDNGSWTFVAEAYCDRCDEIPLPPVNGRYWGYWRRGSEIWHPLLGLNPYVTDRGVAPPEDETEQLREWLPRRYVSFSINGHHTTIYYERYEADMSYDYMTVSVKLRLGNNNVIHLTEKYDQNRTSVEQKYLLCTGTYTKGIGLIDLENGEVLLKELRVAFWAY